MRALRVALMGNFSLYPFRDELGAPAASIHRVTTWNETLAEAMALEGASVHVLTLARGGKGFHACRGRLEVTYLGIPRLANALTGYGYTGWRARRILRRLRPDIVHGIGTENIWPTVALGAGFPSVITIHGVLREILRAAPPPLFSRQRFFSALEGRVIRKASHAIAITPYIERILQNRGARRIYPIENPVSDRFFEVTTLATEYANILFVGHTGPGKGLLTLLEAFARVRQQGYANSWRITVVGPPIPGAYQDSIREFVSKAALGDSVSFRGFLLPHDMAEEYAQSAFLVLPSRQETAPMSIAEAMACGRPAVATRVGGVPDLISDGRTGFLVDVGDSAMLAARLELLVTNRRLLHEMGDNSRREAEKRWRARRIARQTIEAYEQILGRNTRAK